MSLSELPVRRLPALTVAVVAALALVAVVAGCGGVTASTAAHETAAARVNGVVVGHDAVERAIKFAKLSGQTLAERAALEQAISEELIRQEAKRLGVTVSQHDLDVRVNALAQGVGGVAALQHQLSSADLTLNDLRTSLEAVMLGERVQATKYPALRATRAQALSFYLSRRSLFHRGAEVQLGDIVVRTQRIALAVIARIKGGQPFANAVRQFSRDPESRDNGGMLGWVGVSALPKPEADAVAELDPGELSPPVNVGVWHILKVIARRPASTIPFSEVSSVIVNELTREQQSAALAKWLKAERKRAKVVVLP